MAATVKVDLFGSSLTAGVTSGGADHAVRRGDVTGLDNDNDDLGDAITAAIADVGQFHQTDTDLPLAAVRAMKTRRSGPKAAELKLIYKHGRWGFPTQPADTIAILRGGSHTKKVYRKPFWKDAVASDGEVVEITDVAWENGLPSGELISPNLFLKNEPPEWVPFTVPILKLYVPTVLDYNPYFSLAQYEGRINTNNVGWAGYTFAAGTLRFDACHVTWAETQQGNLFNIRYDFTGMYDGFYEQEATWKAADPPPQWFVNNTLKHNTAAFPTFPVHA